MAVVHQEPQLFPNLTVSENLMVGREGTRALVRDLRDSERQLMADLAILDVADVRCGASHSRPAARGDRTCPGTRRADLPVR